MGKFDENGRCGYVLKPEQLTASKLTFNPFMVLPIENVVPLSMSVKVRVCVEGGWGIEMLNIGF